MVEPMMSTKSAVTSFRSPSAVACEAGARLTEMPGTAFSGSPLFSCAVGLPQALQKRASRGFEAPHREQMSCKGEPQEPQYFDASGLSRLHVRHRASTTAHL